ncbi:MAG: tyrosine-protein phosphatase [Eubacteriales bacterium]|nr:tyrosine-protein phosphatase [Eubacteriales bacterium]MDD3880799.1 tyrosine-protein phosphatase [Eubacteriales bacterium]MDD4511834.1 tyrosine-protein phosphatase [Eubacteriales bacterium]
MKKLLVFLLVLLMAFPAFAAEAPLTGTIDAADKHGNVSTTLPADDLLKAFAIGDLLSVEINNQKITAPLVTRYSDVNVGEPLVFTSDGKTCFAINYKSFQSTYGAEVGTEFSIELLSAGAYLSEYEIRNLVKSENRDDCASDEIFANFRPIIDGVLYRGANPNLDDARSPYVEAFVSAAGIKTIVNLVQTDEEANTERAKFPEAVVVTAPMGVDTASDEFKASLKTALTAIAENEAPYFIHCNEGKDRAGIVSAIIEGVIGFTPDEIVADYMLSYENYYGVEKGTEKYELLSQQIKTIIESLTGAPMNADTLSARLTAYLKDEIGFDASALVEKLK